MWCGRLSVNVGSFIKCVIILQGTNAMQLSWKKAILVLGLIMTFQLGPSLLQVIC